MPCRLVKYLLRISVGALALAVLAACGSSDGEPRVDGIRIEPGYVALLPGDTQQFTAVAQLSDGLSPEVNPEWSARGGTITSLGFYTAGQVDGFHPVAAELASSGLVDTAEIAIATVPATLASVELPRGDVTMQVGDERVFEAVGRLETGEIAYVPINYSITGGGTLEYYGRFVATTAGTFRLIAASPSFVFADTATVTILPAAAPVRSAR